MLVFGLSDDGALKGFSFQEYPVRLRGSDKNNRVISRSTIAGNLEVSSSQEVRAKYQFTTTTPSGLVVNNIAEIIPATGELKGKSTVESKINGVKSKVTYDWTAERKAVLVPES